MKGEEFEPEVGGDSLRKGRDYGECGRKGAGLTEEKGWGYSQKWAGLNQKRAGL